MNLRILVVLFSVTIIVACDEQGKRMTLPDPEGGTKDGEMKHHSIPPKTLKNTGWNSEFYHYHNFYFFETDSTGYSEDGQVAWSTPIDLKKNKISEDEILYGDKALFAYKMRQDTLIIKYQKDINGITPLSRKFTYNDTTEQWISVYEYAYGKEYLKKGEKQQKFQAVPILKE